MLKERAREVAAFVAVIDGILLAIAFPAAYLLRDRLLGPLLGEEQLAGLPSYTWILYLSVPLLLLLFRTSGLYGSLRRLGDMQVIALTMRPFLAAFAGMGLIVFLIQDKLYSRSVFVGYFAIGFTLICLEKLSLRALSRAVRRRGYNTRNVVIVGADRDALTIGALLQDSPEYGYHVLGHLIGLDGVRLQNDDKAPLGTATGLPALLDREAVDEVVFAVPYSQIPAYEGLIRHCEEIGLRIHLKLDGVGTILARTSAGELGPYPLLTLASAPQGTRHAVAKRLIDLLVSTLGLLLTAPLMLAAAAAVRLSSSGPALFRQTRLGLNGRRFTLYKFRSMHADAERRLVEVRPRNEMNGPVFKMTGDPRVTPVGRFLRKWSIDELPQLWNVLRGDMSLVGPRPPIPGEVARYERWHKRRLSVKPGITCLWQIRGRNSLDFDEWMRLDMHYIDNWSLRMDMAILARTIPAVLLARGAR